MSLLASQAGIGFGAKPNAGKTAFTSNVQSSSTAESGDSHRRRMKNGASTHAPLHQAVNSFFGGVKQFAAHAESEARDIRTSVEKPPLSGTQGTLVIHPSQAPCPNCNEPGTCRLFFTVYEEDEDGRESPAEGCGNDAFPIHERGLI